MTHNAAQHATHNATQRRLGSRPSRTHSRPPRRAAAQPATQPISRPNPSLAFAPNITQISADTSAYPRLSILSDRRLLTRRRRQRSGRSAQGGRRALLLPTHPLHPPTLYPPSTHPNPRLSHPYPSRGYTLPCFPHRRPLRLPLLSPNRTPCTHPPLTHPPYPLSSTPFHPQLGPRKLDAVRRCRGRLQRLQQRVQSVR